MKEWRGNANVFRRALIFPGLLLLWAARRVSRCGNNDEVAFPPHIRWNRSGTEHLHSFFYDWNALLSYRRPSRTTGQLCLSCRDDFGRKIFHVCDLWEVNLPSLCPLSSFTMLLQFRRLNMNTYCRGITQGGNKVQYLRSGSGPVRRFFSSGGYSRTSDKHYL